jgi:hypothetical protein
VTVELNRRFVECNEEEPADPELVARFSLLEARLSWDDLLAKRRVVLLAEAGSGKTTEMIAQARRQANAGRPAFYLTLEDVGRAGLETALKAADRAPFAAWRATDEQAWFFIDSVDEAKDSGVKLRTAFRAIANGISGAERRSHVILSGRYTDWQFRKDLELLNDELAIPADETLPPPPTADELVVSTIHRERSNAPSSSNELPTIVVMAGLDEGRVRHFATPKALPHLDAFIGQIKAANLWQFARRPLDLEWLTQFWQTTGRLGSLAEMLALSIDQRLQEPNLDRRRLDKVEVARAIRAVERVAAAMIFERKATILVPDAEVSLAGTAASSIKIAEVLTDWSPEDQARLFTRAVFDPATFGRARFHNDNEGVVRSYLTARWLLRLRQSNLSQQGLSDLLFGEVYDINVIKPSMREVAAWLCLWDQYVLREIERRDPFLLLTAGDPEGLSTRTRETILKAAIDAIIAGRRAPLLDHDSLRRFSRTDLANCVRRLWVEHKDDPEARKFLLRVIWLGEIRECSDLAADAALSPNVNVDGALYAGRALMVIANDTAKQRYADYVRENCRALRNTVSWDAFDELFPSFLSVDDLLHVMGQIDVADRDGGLGLDWHGPKFVGKLQSTNDLEHLLQGLLTQLGGAVSAIDREENDRERAYFPTIAATAHRLLTLLPEDQVSIAAVDAAVRLGNSARRFPSARRGKEDVIAELQKSTSRRRGALWRFVERLEGKQLLGGEPLQALWPMRMFGWSIDLSVDDIDWLLSDAPTRATEHERRLAIDAALTVWGAAGSSEALRDRIGAIAKADPAMEQVFDAWTNPRPPSLGLIESNKQLELLQRRNALESAARDRSWTEFATTLRERPDEVMFAATTNNGADAKLHALWGLLRMASGSEARYALDSVAPLVPMIGAAAAERVRVGLIAHWRARKPWLRSARKTEDQNRVSDLDCMGITGVTLEALGRPDWGDQLTSDEAQRVSGFATLELNGFPNWLTALVQAKPNDVLAIFSTELVAEFDRSAEGAQYGILQDIARADATIAELVAPIILTQLRERPKLPPTTLSYALEICVRGKPAHRARLNKLVLSRFRKETDPMRASEYIGAAFQIDGKSATEVLFTKLDKLAKADQAVLVQRVLPRVFGDRMFWDGPPLHNMPVESLERIVRLAFEAIRVEDDNVHQSGHAYSVNARDHAEHARSAAFNRLVTTPGRATFNAILRLAAAGAGFPIPSQNLQDLARRRASEDAESAPWKPGDVIAFERTAETEPQTSRDLQVVAMRRLSDMQYDLRNDDYQQGDTLAALSGEKRVQRWIADRMRLKQGRSYSVEREVHVADENEPDVRLRAKVTDANVPVEVKIAEAWSLKVLEDALTKQLCGKYLRQRENRQGILLLVHQKARRGGWKKPDGTKLNFGGVVAHLEAMAIVISGLTSDAPQPAIAVLDVASFNTDDKAEKMIRKNRQTRNKAIKARRARKTTSGQKHQPKPKPKPKPRRKK